MEKSVFTPEYRALLKLLRETRQRAGVTQVELAARLNETQSYISKVERGEIRLDVIQLRTLCMALETSLPEFIGALEVRLPSHRRRKANS